MTTKRKRTASKKRATSTARKIVVRDLDEAKTQEARIALTPSLNAAAVLEVFGTWVGGDEAPDIGDLAASLSAGTRELWAGDMKRGEAMLFSQAHALQGIFVNLARRAAKQEYLKQWDAYMRMALKAQAQCRMTIETLATIKDPPTVFAKQANINNGGQKQVNNGAQPPCVPAAILESPQTGLLEARDGERLDTGTKSATGSADPHLETVGALHRPEDG